MNAATDLEVDVAIVGAGLVGASLALSLAQRSDCRIALIESTKATQMSDVPDACSPIRGLRVSALGNVAENMLNDIGVWADLEVKTPYQKMVVWDNDGGGQLAFTDQHNQHTALGHIVDNIECLALLHQRIEADQRINSFFSSKPIDLSDLDQSPILSIKGSGGLVKRIRSKVLLACDGRNSWVRQQINTPLQSFQYQQKGIVALVRALDSASPTAWQNFLKTGPLALLPYQDDLYSIVWSADNNYADQLLALSDREFTSQLNNFVSDRLGEVELVSIRMAFPLASQIAQHFVQDNIVLMGDAAHAIHPLAGQGANLGFKDAQLLADILTAPNALSQHKVLTKNLREYAKQRKLDADLTDKLMTTLYLSFHSMPAWLRPLRSSAMSWINGNQALKQRFVALALGS